MHSRRSRPVAVLPKAADMQTAQRRNKYNRVRPPFYCLLSVVTLTQCWQDVLEDLDPSIEPVLSKAIIKQGNREVVRLGDKELDWSHDFRLYITTKLGNPHYTPEVTEERILRLRHCREPVLLCFSGTPMSLQAGRMERGEIVVRVFVLSTDAVSAKHFAGGYGN